MIRKIVIKHCPNKHNFIDQNKVVCGCDMETQSSEEFGYGVYDINDHHLVAKSPEGLDYHFDYASYAAAIDPRFTNSVNPPANRVNYHYGTENSGEKDDDAFQVTLINDSDPTKKLIFEFYNCHNGWYFHDFSIEKQ